MDFKRFRIKSFNALVFMLIALQLIVLMVTMLFFVASDVGNELPMTTILGAILLLLFCVPICFVLYRTNTDQVSRAIFLALALAFFIIALSGIMWYILPINIHWDGFIPIAKLLTIISYIPIILILGKIFIDQRHKLQEFIQKFIIYLNILFSGLILYYIITYMLSDINQSFDIFIYSMSIIGDEIVLVLSTILILINIPTNRRYILSIIFSFYVLSFIGDSARLLGYLNIYDIASYSETIYGVMFLLTAVALLIYALSNIKIITIEEMNKELQDTSLLVEDLIMQSPVAMCMCNSQGIIIKSNQLFIEIFGLKKTIDNLNIFDVDVLGSKFNTDNLHIKDNNITNFDNIKTVMCGEEKKYLSINMFPTYTSEGKLSKYVFIAEDITSEKKAEEALKVANEQLETRVKERTSELSILNEALQKEIFEHNIDEERIKSSLREKEVLLKEIHHRVKNNMQIISSMLGLQSAFVIDKKFNDMLTDSQNRIKSMALIHEKLYQSDNMAMVNFKEYVNSLITNLTSSYCFNRNNIKINQIIEDCYFNIDLAIPLGLIINELVSNSFKHAFPEDKSGEITIQIKSPVEGKYQLLISDNGIGLANGMDIYNTNTLGLKLVQALTEQIDGKLEVISKNGMTFLISFQYIDSR